MIFGKFRTVFHYMRFLYVEEIRYKYAGKYNFTNMIKKIIIYYKCILKGIKLGKKILFRDYVYLNFVEMVITTKCSLKCKNCGNFIPHYKKPYDVDHTENIKSIEALLDSVDEIGRFALLGGEPLLYSKIEDLIKALVNSKKVNEIRIITNGTIEIKDELTKLLQNPKVVIYISNYGKFSYKIPQIRSFCAEKNIRCYIGEEDSYWLDIGGCEKRKRPAKQLKKQYKKCVLKDFRGDNSLFHGQLHHCARSSNGNDLGYFKSKNYEYVDLIKSNTQQQKREKMKFFIYGKVDAITACDYCNKKTKLAVRCTPGEQI